MPGAIGKRPELRIGFVPLLDAAPIIAAQELGYFAQEGLKVVLERQIGWGNVRDKLTFGHLHASHALLGMPAASVLKWPRYPEPLVGILSLGFGGNAISISRRLSDAGVKSGADLAMWVKRSSHGQLPPLFAHVFSCSTHHYLLREWLSASGIDPDKDVRLCVLPPPQMVGQMKTGYLDGFCVGEPWNSVAEIEGCGTILTLTTDLVPDHPEKVLAVTRRWLNENPQAGGEMVRALVKAGEFCGDARNRDTLARMLAGPKYMGMDKAILKKCGGGYTVSPAAMFPSATHVAWLLNEMKRWGHLDAGTEILSVAAQSTDSAIYRAVAEKMGSNPPAHDFPTMPLRTGLFHPTKIKELQRS